MLYLVHHCRRTVATTSHEQRHTSGHSLHEMLLQLLLLLLRQRGRLGRRTHNAEEVGPSPYLIFDQAVQCIKVNAPIMPERGYQRYAKSSETILYHILCDESENACKFTSFLRDMQDVSGIICNFA